MKFKNKYPNAIEGQHYGDFGDFIYSPIEKPCLECKEPTHFVDIFSEGHFCSDECANMFYTRMNIIQQMEAEDEVFSEVP